MTPAEFVVKALHDRRSACSEACISHVYRATKKKPARMTVVIPDSVAEALQGDEPPVIMMVEVGAELKEELLSPIVRPGVVG